MRLFDQNTAERIVKFLKNVKNILITDIQNNS